MKKQIIALSVALIATVSSSFAQGYVTVASSPNYVWDEFTTVGSSVKAPGSVSIAVYWAPTGTVDPLQSVGGGASQSVFTNGVTSISSPANVNTALTGAGFTLATVYISGGTVITTTNNANGGISYGQVQVQGMSGGTQYELIVVGWNKTPGSATALTSGTYTAIGWSNPFLYTAGANNTDPNGTASLNADGMIKWGVAPAGVPEPGTMALAALGGASLLLFRRRK